MEEKFKQLLDDEEFAEKLVNAGSPDEFVALLNEKGITLEEGLTAEQVAAITDIVTAETDFTAAQLKVVEVKA